MGVVKLIYSAGQGLRMVLSAVCVVLFAVK